MSALGGFGLETSEEERSRDECRCKLHSYQDFVRACKIAGSVSERVEVTEGNGSQCQWCGSGAIAGQHPAKLKIVGLGLCDPARSDVIMPSMWFKKSNFICCLNVFATHFFFFFFFFFDDEEPKKNSWFWINIYKKMTEELDSLKLN